MGKVFYNKHAIPVPEGCYIDKSDGRVLARIPDADGNYKRRTIGVLSTRDTMYPNELFQQRYRDLWEKYYPSEPVKEYEISVGMYGLILGISHHIRFYHLLKEIYGESDADHILDVVMASCLFTEKSTQPYSDRMRKELHFAEQAYSDEWVFAFFERHMTEELNHEFRMRWLQYCRSTGVTKAWICIDGSSSDGEAEQSSLPEQGEAKEHGSSGNAGYMYAVGAGDGRPVTYVVYEGSRPDRSDFHQIARMLAGVGIETAGVILDAKFCTDDVLQTLDECSLEYVVMMHSSHLGHASAVKEWGETIRWNPQYLVSDDGVFGTCTEKQLFSAHSRKGYVNVFFDAVKGTRESIQLSKELRTEKRRLECLLQSGKHAEVKAAYSKYLEITEHNSKQRVHVRYEKWKQDTDAMGFFSIVSSSDFGAEHVHHTCHLRDASQTTYRLFKSQQGLQTARVHSVAGMRNTFAVGFITSIIKTEIETACRALNLDTNAVIQGLEHVHVFLAPGNTYLFGKPVRKDLNSILTHFGMTSQHFDALASEISVRLDSRVRSSYRGIPVIPASSNAAGKGTNETRDDHQSDKQDNALETNSGKVPEETGPASDNFRPKRGRKKGSKDTHQRKRRTKAEIERDRSGGI